MRRLGRIPRPLLAVLCVVAVAGVAWTFAVPALQGADEGAHFAYVQKIADAHTIPWRGQDDGLLESAFAPSVSSEQRLAWLWAGLEPLRGNLAARPLWTKEDERIWARQAATLTAADRRDGVGSEANRNPPLYYLSAVIPYEIARGSFFDRLYALRLYNVVLLLVTIGLTWLLAGELFARRREMQVIAVTAAGLQPVLLDTVTRVTPDALLMTLTTAALYAMTLLVRRGFSWRMVGWLALAVVAACFTQGRGIGLIGPALVAIGLAGWRRWGDRGRLVLRRHGIVLLWLVGAAVALVAFGLYATDFRPRHMAGFWSYLWQFYLPKLPGMSTPLGSPWSAGNVYLDRFFGTFVQFEVTLPTDALDALRLVIYAGFALLAVSAWRHRGALWMRRDVVTVLVATLLLEILSLHAAAFRALLVNPADPVITGRYLVMLIPLFGIGVAGALAALPGRLRAGVSGATLAGLFLLQLSAFGLVVARFYA
jgi:hypothetical protein